MTTTAALDLGPRARVVFAAAWILGQSALVATGSLRADRAFAFRMFQESSTLEVHLRRRVDGPADEAREIDVVDGEWTALGGDGARHRIRWDDAIPIAGLATFDVELHASYGVDAHVAEWRAALDYVATHTAADAETRALVLSITARKNGGAPYLIRIERARP